jgi:hypothetical protein
MNSRRLFLPQGLLFLLLILVLSYCILFREDPGKSHMPEALKYISLMTKLQSYRVKDGNKFSDTLEKLKIGLPKETNSYIYSIKIVGSDWAENIAVPKVDGLKSYIGLVHSYKDKANQPETAWVLCVSEKNIRLVPSDFIRHVIVDGYPLCPNGYKKQY